MSTTTTTKTTSIINTNDKTLRKIEEVAVGLANSWTKRSLSVPEEVVVMIFECIKAMKSEINLSDSYRRDIPIEET